MSWRIQIPTLLFATLLAARGGAPVFAGDTTLDQRERFVLSEINRIRAEQGLSQLRVNDKLCAIARIHSSNMAEYGYLAHTDSQAGVFEYVQREGRSSASDPDQAHDHHPGRGRSRGVSESEFLDASLIDLLSVPVLSRSIP